MSDEMKFDLLDSPRVLPTAALGSGDRGSPLADLVARFEAAEPARADDRRLSSASLRAGRVIRAMRLEAGLSQVQLAKKLDVSQARISELEVGLGKQGPTLDLFERIAAACGQRVVLEPMAKRARTA